MKFSKKNLQLLIGTAGLGIAISFLPAKLGLQLPQLQQKAIAQTAQALSPEEVNLRAKQTTVRIDGANVGSGSIIESSDKVYTVLTNWHVMKNSGEYTVKTIDGRNHQVDSASIKKLPGLDLAVLKFDSQQNYQTIETGDANSLNEGQSVYFAGYPGELRREDNRYYRFFTANLVGILPKSTENGYSLIYNGEAFPGMSGGPVFNQAGLMIGIHGEANINAVSGGTSNYGIPINSYKSAIAKLNTTPVEIAQPETAPPDAVASETEAKPKDSNSPANPPAADVAKQPESEASKPETAQPKTGQANNQPEESEADSADSGEVDSVPTFSPEPTKSPTTEAQAEPESNEEPQAEVPDAEESKTESAQEVEQESEPKEPEESATEAAEKPQEKPQVATKPQSNPAQPKKTTPESPADSAGAETNLPKTSRRISLISAKTGIDYTKLRNLLKEEKWSEADIYTYKLVKQIVKTAKQENRHVFIELKTIAKFSCPDIRTIDNLWREYSDNKFGFSSQQEVWQSVNQKGDFSTETWRQFATEVGWKTGVVASEKGYLLFDQLNFNPSKAPSGHLPWWFALPDEEQNVIKSLFARCNFNPSVEELEAENSVGKPEQKTSNNSQPNINKTPKSSESKN